MRIVVAMSGGVDSSVAAALLAEQGHDVIGLSMQLYDQSSDRSFGSCCSLEDLYDARRVATAINIPHYILNFEKQFDEHVVSNFVREYAHQRGLPVADKPDSQEICFIPDHDYAGFLTKHSPELAHTGDVVDETGRVLAQHGGIHRFTVGQRKGLGLPTTPTGAPMYVLALKPDDRQVVVGPKAALERTTLSASGVNWIEGVPAAPVRASVQIRHRHPAAPAMVRAVGDGRADVIFDAPQIAITPGQAAVFFDGDVVL